MAEDPQALETRARAGDLNAQFELAVTLDRAGNRLVATSWLEAAATNGHPEALALLAVRDLQGIEHPRQPERARARLERAVSLGGNTARRLHASLTAIGVFGPPDWRSAVTLLIDAAKEGDWQALRYLAFLVEMAEPCSPRAEDLLLRAAVRGDGLAGYAVVRRQDLYGRTLAPERVFALWRDGLAKIGHPLAHRIATTTASAETSPMLPEGQPDFDAIATILAAPPGLKVAAPKVVSENPLIRRFDNLLTIEECEYIVGVSWRMLAPASVIDATARIGTQSGLRTNSVAVLWPVQQDLVVHAINLRLAAAAGLPAQNGEMANILMYRPGEEYRAHFDFFAPEIANTDPSGQRVRTLLVNLNTDYEGGETHFPHANAKLKGNTGDAVLFYNCDSSGAPDRTSLHAGLPVTRGQKWLLSKWYREKAFVY
jgi:hypothetical protein